MIYHNRPLGISLLLHALLLGLFLFWLSSAVQKKQDEPLKIHLSSFATPAHQSIQPLLPPKQQAPVPIPKNIPAPPVISTQAKPSPPITARPTLPTPIMQTMSQTAPVISTPTPVAPPKTVAPTPQLPPAPPINVEKEFINEHLGEIRGLLLQNLKYPKMAQKLKMQGEVRIAFSLNSDGSVEDIKIIESSGFDLLDEDAKMLIEKTASHFPKPSKSVRISVPLSYVLR